VSHPRFACPSSSKCPSAAAIAFTSLRIVLGQWDMSQRVTVSQIATFEKTSQGILQGLDAEGSFHRDRQPPRQNPAGRPIETAASSLVNQLNA
jgi:hypothetical protein